MAPLKGNFAAGYNQLLGLFPLTSIVRVKLSCLAFSGIVQLRSLNGESGIVVLPVAWKAEEGGNEARGFPPKERAMFPPPVSQSSMEKFIFSFGLTTPESAPWSFE